MYCINFVCIYLLLSEHFPHLIITKTNMKSLTKLGQTEGICIAPFLIGLNITKYLISILILEFII